MEPSDLDWHYRTKLTLHAAQRGRLIGLHPYDRPDRVFDLERCEITTTPLVALWQAVRRHRALLPPDLTQVVLRLDRSGARHLIAATEGHRPWNAAGRLLAQLRAEGHEAVLWWRPASGAPRVMAGNQDAFPATVFEQVHPGLGDRIREYAIEQLGDVGGARVWDLYAGVGDTTRELLRRGAMVESIELDQRAVEQAEKAARAGEGMDPGSQRPLDLPVIRHVGRVEEVIPRLRSPDLIITNPPRGGMEPSAVEAIARSGARRLVYVSCDPATLARDLARLVASGAMRLVRCQAFDLFPQTAHVETVAVLEAA